MPDDSELSNIAGARTSGGYRGKANRSIRTKIWCKSCKRQDYHYLDIKPKAYRLVVKVVTFGLIGLVGKYRCSCCGKARIGRFDFVRGPEKPKRQSKILFSKKDDKSFKSELRKYRRTSFLQKTNPVNWYLTGRDSWKSVKRRGRIKAFMAGLRPRRKRSPRRYNRRRH